MLSPLSENLSLLTLSNGKRTGYLNKFNKLQQAHLQLISISPFHLILF